ncbi:MAG: ATPase, T2SS/T4P/T4SS family [Limisphaerales bacterium]
MSSPLTTFEVRQAGQPARLVRFGNPEISIGFAKHCDLPLEPSSEDGSELKLIIRPRGPCLLRATRNPGKFLLNGQPFATETKIACGDVIAQDSYQITVRSLPESGLENPPKPDAARQQHPERVGELRPDPSPGKAAAAVGPTVAPADKASEPASEEEPATRAFAATQAPRAEPAATAKPQANLSYLFLFFAPVQEFLMDDDVAEIMINGPRQIYIERKGKVTSVPATFSGEQALQAAVMNVARSIGRFFNQDNPRLDARLPDGSRVHAVMPPLSRQGTVVAIRKFRRERLTLQQLIEFGSLSADAARLLEVIVKTGKNLLISGATSSGKTSVLNVLSGCIPEQERILVLEDASELQLQQAHVVCFETRKADEYGKGEVTIRDLLHSALRLRPDRLVVGEIRGGEALDLLQAMNTGHEGSMSTIHANTARDSLLRLETCALLSGVEIPLSALREQVASAIHVVVQTARLFDGSRKITTVSEVLGLKDREYQLQDILVFEQEELLSNGRVKGRHAFTGHKPTFLAAAQRRVFDLSGLFTQ